MSGAWTPGPWLCEHRRRRGEDGYYTEVFTEDGGTGSGRIATLDWYPKPPDPATGAIGTYRDANANLISAAPDLFEALSTFVEDYVELVNSGDAGHWDPEKEPKVIAARVALNKALGK